MMGAALESVLLRIFVAEEDRHAGRPLCEAIVAKALENKMAGATVLYGPVGYGRSGNVRSEITVDAGSRLPVVVEMIDTEAKIEGFLQVLDGMVDSGLVTMAKVRAVRYRRRAAG
jgi:PII-like signaling protein